MIPKIDIAIVDPTPIQHTTISVHAESYDENLTITPLHGTALTHEKINAYDLILLPIGHPAAHNPADGEGIYQTSTPIILFGERQFTRTALSLPCKDFLPLPFVKEELLGRILRAAPTIFLLYGELHLRLHEHSVSYGMAEVPLSPDERIILQSLAEAWPEPVPRTILYRNLHKDLPKESRYIDVVIAGLRKKLISLTARETTPIHAERSLGYRL